MNDHYSTKKISSELLKQITEALKQVNGWGSVELFIQDYKVTQITQKNIQKLPNLSTKNQAVYNKITK
jgi:hypothetical protein